VLQRPEGPLHVSQNRIVGTDGGGYGELVVVTDMSFVERRSTDTKKYVLYLFAAIATVVALITVIIAEISWRGWNSGLKALVKGETLLRSPVAWKSASPELRPIARDLQALVLDLESERRTRDESQTSWGPTRCGASSRQDLKGDEVLIVSNREPYIHTRRKDNVIEIQRPASGLVTALEPIVRATSGTWIAHGAGQRGPRHRRQARPRHGAARASRLPHPPRVAVEGRGAGLLLRLRQRGPVAALPHRPYAPDVPHAGLGALPQREPALRRHRGRRGAHRDPIILVQDYHFALLPRMVRERLPRATIITFWHIPWPNPEAFGILPGARRSSRACSAPRSSASTPSSTATTSSTRPTASSKRASTARPSRSPTAATDRGAPLPDLDRMAAGGAAAPGAGAECRKRVRERLGSRESVKLGVGVDRLDYTKGILERFMAIERLLELEPRWVGQFAFIQVAAPVALVDRRVPEPRRPGARARRAHQRALRAPGYEPIILKIEHHDAVQVYELYRAAELCYVSSLHDGMNLVAKEFVAARDDEQGVLILSQFTGAARELSESLIVNPYDIEQSAAAMHLALTMSPDEQRARMRSMRTLVQEFNVFRWAGRMLLDAARMRHRRRVMSRARAARRRAGTG
jgi:trehalose 6-phosphate synthase